ncbi:MAG: hypothetical protein HKN34_02600 [Gammaproteobacteria bacterium]|nr:hypothetical protein [Gammaproteobacteria bacterium]
MDMLKRLNNAEVMIIPVLLCLFLSLRDAAAEVEVGEIEFSRGALTGQLEGESVRLLGKGQVVMQGETLSTGNNSFAVVQLNDGTRMTLRPKTVFKVDQLNTNSGQENALLSLIKGGFRAITGSISKSLKGVFKVNTGIATIGIRGTEFDARICDESDCDSENRLAENDADESSAADKAVIARVALLQGTAWVSGSDGRTRSLRVGEAIYELDHLNTGINSFLVVGFNDKSRMTLTSNSELKIQEHRYEPEKPSENSSVLEFLRGGLRMISGAIGSLNRAAFEVRTPLVTIGIRGTGFDVLCRTGCANSQNSVAEPVEKSFIGRLFNLLLKPAVAQNNNAGGLFTRVWSGSIDMLANGQSLIVGTNQVGHSMNKQAIPRLTSFFPPELTNMQGSPRPDSVPFKPEWFGAENLGKAVPAGLYVNVREGVVLVEGKNGQQLPLTRNQAGRVDLSGAVFRLNRVPGFQRFDQFPLPGNITARLEGLMNLSGKLKTREDDFKCF